MKGYMEIDDGFVGIGISKEEALQDLYCQKCSADISQDVNKRFTKRRELLHPWMPTRRVLHFTSVGSLFMTGNSLVEQSSGNTYNIPLQCKSPYTVFAYLFGKRLSYEDIKVVARGEIDAYLSYTSRKFISLGKMPLITLLDKGIDFKPETLYMLRSGLILGIDDRYVGICSMDSPVYYGVKRDSGLNLEDSVIYIGYRLGYCITGEEVVGIG